MTHRLTPIVLSIALAASLLGSACSKKTSEAAAPRPAAEAPAVPSITGLIEPVGGVTGVILSDNTTHQPVAGATPDGLGAYQFRVVPAGTYTLNFNQQRGYVRPRQRSVTVMAGQTTVVPLVTAVQSTGSWAADGVMLPPPFIDLSIAYDGTNFIPPGMFALELSDAPPALTPAANRLYLCMLYDVRVGTYALDGATAYAIFIKTPAGVFDSRLNPVPGLAGGTLTITAVENTVPFPRSVSGTFRFTGINPARGTQTSLSGTFENAYF